MSGICPQWSAVVGCNQYLVLTDHDLHLHDHRYVYSSALFTTTACFVPKLHSGTQSGNNIDNHMTRS